MLTETRHYVRYDLKGDVSYGRLDGDTIHTISGNLFGENRETGDEVSLESVRLLPPSEPSKVLAVGLNYQSHAGMSGAARPELFAKLPSSLVGHDGNIVFPADANRLHFEGELVVIIGKQAKHISEAEVPDHIFGISIGNDVSERGWQGSDLQWLRAKAADTFGPVGPSIATGLNYNDLLLETRVNGKVVQSERTNMLIHSVDKIVSFTSRYFTLEPGDMIFTGTPGQTSSLNPGDIVEIELEDVGVLRNRVTQA
jgi:2-keto-4-pentenoate hydratase/2-oxohepta-3-ene-1,7-dioic acid hydratase in catechol pathway